MFDFETFISRHSEVLAQAIVEDWERCHRIRHSHMTTLEERWAHFIRATDPVMCRVAA